LERLPAVSPESGMIRTYLDWVVSLPWNTTTGEAIDLAHARQILDEDHYDLERIKDRILEYLAVKKLKADRQVQETQQSAQKNETENAKQKESENIIDDTPLLSVSEINKY